MAVYKYVNVFMSVFWLLTASLKLLNYESVVNGFQRSILASHEELIYVTAVFIILVEFVASYIAWKYRASTVSIAVSVTLLLIFSIYNSIGVINGVTGNCICFGSLFTSLTSIHMLNIDLFLITVLLVVSYVKDKKNYIRHMLYVIVCVWAVINVGYQLNDSKPLDLDVLRDIAKNHGEIIGERGVILYIGGNANCEICYKSVVETVYVLKNVVKTSRIYMYVNSSILPSNYGYLEMAKGNDLNIVILSPNKYPSIVEGKSSIYVIGNDSEIYSFSEFPLSNYELDRYASMDYD